MNKLLKYLVIALILALPHIVNAQKITRAEYIEMYKGLAIKKMKLHGIPASITLAQGILESNSGNSTLARMANNHFGIKCHKGWTGETMYRTDDLPDECFRKYKSAEGSYEDHSLFLRGYSRYAFLFDLEPTDYAEWARGLKKAGYATAPTYADMLIKVINDCNLAQYDTGVEVEVESPNVGKEEAYGIINEKGKIEKDKVAAPAVPEVIPEEEEYVVETEVVNTPTGPKTITKKRKANEDNPYISGGLAVDDEQYTVDIYNARRVYIRNRVKYIKARSGDTFDKINKELHLLPFELYKYNELGQNTKLRAGQVLYLQPKRKKASVNHKVHVAEAGETMYHISQMYAVKLSSLYKLNRMDEGNEVEEGQLIYLRSKKKAL